jgi:hypothetical protein
MPTIINNFHKGQSSSPYINDGAFAKSQNLDVFGQPGIARINYLPTGYSTNLTGLPISFATNSDQAATIYFADDAEDVYSMVTTTGAITKIGDNKGNNVEYFQLADTGYLWATYRNTVNKYDLAATTWSDSTFTLSSLAVKDNHFMFVSKNDGKLYVCGTYSSGFGIGSLTSANSWTQMAFTMPKGLKPISITEIDRYLIISAKMHRATTEAEFPETTYLFWDGTSSTSSRIVTVPEKNMTNFIKRGDAIYITGGTQGNIYRLTESGIQFYAKIPFDCDNKQIYIGNVSDTDGTNSFQSGAWFKDRLMIGVSSEDTLSPAGLYGVRDGGVCHEINPSNGDDASTNDIYIGGMLAFSNDNLYYGWKKVASGPTTTYGVDVFSEANNRTTSYGAYLESILYPVGTKDNKKSFDKVEVQLARPLQTGEGIKIEYRKNATGTWTELGTQTYATNGAVSSLEFAGIHNLENVQIKISLTTGATVNTPHILEIRCLP